MSRDSLAVSARPSRRGVELLSAKCGMAAAGLMFAVASPASAYLGSFTPNDGYNIVQPWVDVTYFNAGAYGANAGGGGWTQTTPDSGKWKVVGPVGGFFTSVAARTAATVGAPAYGPVPSSGLPIYIVGDHGPGRTDNSALAFRNDTPAGTGAANYDYGIDTYDTGGTAPATVTSGVVSAQMYFLPNPDVMAQPGTRAGDKFFMSFKDSSGNIGAQWGYARDNEVYWRAGSSGPWNYTGVIANSGNWDGIKISIDLTADTFALDYYKVATSSWVNLAAAGTALGASMTNLTNLGWHLEDATNNGVGGKNFFDDVGFGIPAPGSAGVLALAGLVAMRRRR
jgi:hypothetical protein